MPIEDEYEAAVAEFESMSATDAATLKSAYEGKVFPLALQRMARKLEAHGWCRQPVDLLLLTAGTQPYSIMMSLVMSPARFVGFFHTDESLKNAEEAASQVFGRGASVSNHEYIKVGKADPIAVYRAVLRIWGERNPRSVVVDVTSGTKAMTLASSSAAMVIGAKQRYVESSQTRHRGWFVREEPHELPHPLVVMGDLTRREAEGLFDHGNYDSAARLFNTLHESGAPEFRYAERAAVARAYADADALRFDDAVSQVDRATLSRLRNASDTKDPICREAERIRLQISRFDELRRGDVSREALLRFFVAYARRRLSQRLFDAAALVHYRTLEMCVAARLASHGVDIDSVTEAALAKAAGSGADELLRRFNTAVVSERYELQAWPAQMGLVQGWTVLDLLGDPLTTVVNSNVLRGQVSMRNRSIFAHGHRPMREGDLERFVKTCELIRTKTAALEGWTLADPDPEFDFVQFQSNLGSNALSRHDGIIIKSNG